ncbi:hypothetical protein GCK32_012156 [Trichostrongylus colubriformis]|uniref:Uncharacterized protein n=1 Tax=Trichostrongylus colubriformis TaxID=6319 RepID=A0AAN8IZF0_TRICO
MRCFIVLVAYLTSAVAVVVDCDTVKCSQDPAVDSWNDMLTKRGVMKDKGRMGAVANDIQGFASPHESCYEQKLDSNNQGTITEREYGNGSSRYEDSHIREQSKTTDTAWTPMGTLAAGSFISHEIVVSEELPADHSKLCEIINTVLEL